MAWYNPVTWFSKGKNISSSFALSNGSGGSLSLPEGAPDPMSIFQSGANLVQNLNPMAWVGDAIGAVGNIFGSIYSNSKQEQLMRETWNREDTAYQRKIADLKAAGLNPHLAESGAGAATSQPGFTVKNPMANFGGDVAALIGHQLDINEARINNSNAMSTALLRYARLEAVNIANNYAPEIAAQKIRYLMQSVGALEHKNDWSTFKDVLSALQSVSRTSANIRSFFK